MNIFSDGKRIKFLMNPGKIPDQNYATCYRASRVSMLVFIDSFVIYLSYTWKELL